MFLNLSHQCISQNVKSRVDENPEYANWKEEKYKIAFEISANTQLTDDEKEVVLLTNLVRLNPQLFLNTFLKDYYKQPNFKKNSYSASLEKDLKQLKPLSYFQFSNELANCAKKHAFEMGKAGKVGHNSANGQSFSKRLRECWPTNTLGENCDYGNQSGIDIFMSLLIDDGISSLGHRKNILSSLFTHFGVSIQKHKVYEVNCVMDFGAKN